MIRNLSLSQTVTFLAYFSLPDKVRALRQAAGEPEASSWRRSLNQTSGDAEKPTSTTTDAAAMPELEDAPFVPLSCPSVLPGLIDVIPGGNVTLRYAVVPDDPPGLEGSDKKKNGILCGRIEAHDHEGYVGLAFSRTPGMTGAEAIIGLPGEGTVLKYNMYDYSDVFPMREERQTLTHASIETVYGDDDDEDDDDGEEGTARTIMTFAKLLVEPWQIPIEEEGENIFLYAHGPDEIAVHTRHTAFVKDFSEDLLPPAPDAADEEAAAEERPPPPAKDCTEELCDFELDPDYLLRYKLNAPEGMTYAAQKDGCAGCTISMELIYDGEAWVSIAFSDNGGKMIGGEAIIGTPEDGNVLKYHMDSKETSGVIPMPESQQTLLNAGVEVKGGQTIMQFTKLMSEPGEIEIRAGDDNNFMGAYGADVPLANHARRHSFVLNLASGASEEVATPNGTAWLVHGILAFLSWSVLVPLAVQASLLRSLLPEGPLWIKLHRALNQAAYVLNAAAFALAVAYTAAEGGAHFRNAHQIAGLVVLVASSGQMVGGAFRPPNPPPGAKKSKTRAGWEVGHRVLGVALLALGFWNAGSGIGLYADKYSVDEGVEGYLNVAYWVWVGLMCAVIVLGGGYFKIPRGAKGREVSSEKEMEKKEGSGGDGSSLSEDTQSPTFLEDSMNSRGQKNAAEKGNATRNASPAEDLESEMKEA